MSIKLLNYVQFHCEAVVGPMGFTVGENSRPGTNLRKTKVVPFRLQFVFGVSDSAKTTTILVATTEAYDKFGRFQVADAVPGIGDGALVENRAAAVLAFDGEVGVVWKIIYCGILATQNCDVWFNHVGHCGHCVRGQAEEEHINSHFVI